MTDRESTPSERFTAWVMMEQALGRMDRPKQRASRLDRIAFGLFLVIGCLALYGTIGFVIVREVGEWLGWW